jgi:hypothetical protein
MRKEMHAVPGFVVLFAGIVLIVHGPIPQLANYHAFADQASRWDIPHAWDVVSNLPFAVVGAWALIAARALPRAPEATGRTIFFASLLLTAGGSSYYHWAPDDARLVFDRLPIAIACAALLSAAHARIHGGRIPGMLPLLLAVAIASVVWWAWTQARGRGDLRPYLMLQGAPLVLIPLWQWLQRSPVRERVLFGAAIALYALAKAFELADRPVMEATGIVGGHTLKHLLAAAAALCIARVFLGRRDEGPAAPPGS